MFLKTASILLGGSLLLPQINHAATCAVPGQYFDLESALSDTICETIEVQAGEYEAGLTVNRSLTILGAGSQSTILTGPGTRPTLYVAGSSHVTLQGLSLAAPSSSDIALSKENGSTLALDSFGVTILPLNASEVFRFPIEGAQEVPPVVTAATGNCSLTLTGLAVNVECTFQGLSSSPLFSHLHLAPAGQNGPVFVTLTPTAATSGTITGSADLTAEQAAELRSGRVYLNLHTQVYPPGELRGQVLPYKPPLQWPEGDGGNGNHYTFFESGVTWQEARTLAALMSHQGVSGHLVTISSAAENDFVVGLVPDGTETWIGLNDIEAEGEFTWTTGEPLEFTQWTDGEPNNFGLGEDAVTLNGTSGEWNDLAETELRSYVVEFEAPSRPDGIFANGFELEE